jgi:hypothetical protein
VIIRESRTPEKSRFGGQVRTDRKRLWIEKYRKVWSSQELWSRRRSPFFRDLFDLEAVERTAIRHVKVGAAAIPACRETTNGIALTKTLPITRYRSKFSRFETGSERTCVDRRARSCAAASRPSIGRFEAKSPRFPGNLHFIKEQYIFKGDL